jgi:hypothetical protein
MSPAPAILCLSQAKLGRAQTAHSHTFREPLSFSHSGACVYQAIILCPALFSVLGVKQRANRQHELKTNKIQNKQYHPRAVNKAARWGEGWTF